MKFLFKLLVFIVALVALVLIVAVFVEKDFKVERQTVVHVDTATTFEYVRHLENQEDFGVWYKLDPDIKIWYEGESGEVGSKVCWESKNKNVGHGEQEIVGIKEGKRIDFKLRFTRPEQIESDLYILTKSNGPEKTSVTWGMKGEVPYPWNLSLLFTDMDAKIGKDFEQGLKNLRVLLKLENMTQDSPSI